MRALLKRLTGKRALVAFVALLVLVAGTVLRAVNPDFLISVRELTFDYYQRLSPRPYESAPVRIVDIDEASIAKFGQWPWPRTKLAELVDALTELGAAAIAFDVIFAEPDRTSPKQFLSAFKSGTDLDLQPLKSLVGRLPDYDRIFADHLREAPSVLGFAVLPNSNNRKPAQKGGIAYGGENPADILPVSPGFLTAFPLLEQAASGSGSVSLSTSDTGGVLRRIPLMFSDGKTLYPGLALEALRIAQGASGFQIRSTGASGETDTGQAAITSAKVGAFTIPTSALGELWVYYSEDSPERYISAANLLDPEQRENFAPKIEGQIVFIGTSAAGLFDVRTTPLGTVVPGVSVHAQATEQIIAGTFLSRPDWANGAETLATFLVGLIVILALPMTGSVGAAFLGVDLVALLIGGSYYLFRKYGLLIDPVYPSLCTFTIFTAATSLLYILSEREKRFVRQAFGQYLAPELVHRLERDPDQLVLGGEIRPMTILFMDIRGFTPLSEQLAPTELVTFLNTLLSPLSDAIQSEQGTIDKYIGDSIMAFWNAPVTIEAHASHACRAALAMAETIDRLNAEDAFGFKARGLEIQTVQIGIGLNSGDACVGNMGSERRFNYSVIGDTVNIAARIEAACKQLGTGLLVSDGTRREASEFAYLEAGEIALKGKAEPVRLFALVGNEKMRGTDNFRRLSKTHSELINALRENHVPEATRHLKDCRATAPDRLQSFYESFSKRIEALDGKTTLPAGDAAE